MGQTLSVVSDTGKPSDTISRERVTFLATVLVCVTPAAIYCDKVPETTPLQKEQALCLRAGCGNSPSTRSGHRHERWHAEASERVVRRHKSASQTASESW